mmetsp:Transcript_12364/g.22441  ORF Transcript_12364/g.22441 Transcript_12364/m.22441 type:complete len:454 (-) Transcript_12364:136-1497(-)|eukprot:CAMPEP_0198294140 /NCGR_PEP_ID=MMETSP1449-20131203/20992_1 /TAXON_ID=420275 /ORGANISM="Attheya septentrionalis, Strain CCMP2084" /LENGTH=453 /DNA_ID=CAMNT_0043994005 /DNA_START=211 /DNA_END=1572 /DNA_ORIENTATION=-
MSRRSTSRAIQSKAVFRSIRVSSDGEKEHVSDALIAHWHRLNLSSSPRQSFFRVLALIFYETTEDETTDFDERQYVVGTNDEPCHIGGSICAERAALVQLRFISNLKRVTKIVICTDAPTEIAPGLLCREFMASHKFIPWNTPILLAGCVCQCCGLDISKETNNKAASSILEPCPSGVPVHLQIELTDGIDSDEQRVCHDFCRVVTTIQRMYPHPSPYVRLNSLEANEFGKHFATFAGDLCVEIGHEAPQNSKKIVTTNNVLVGKHNVKDNIHDQGIGTKELLKMATDESSKDSRLDLHPIQYGAAVLFSDGTVATAHQKKGLEYGCTLDAVSQLAHVIELKCHASKSNNLDVDDPIEPRKNEDTVRPVWLVQSDQYGIAHAPFAKSRAFLSEYGYGDCRILLHRSHPDLYIIENGKTDTDRKAELELIEVTVDELAPNPPDVSGGILLKTPT